MFPCNEEQNIDRRRWLWVFFALLPFITIPILGSLFYFRHDDSAILLWAKEFTKPFYLAFSSDPNVNEYYRYTGMGDRWRPCAYLYVKLLWFLFGANPAPYYIVGGVVFMIAVYFLFKIAEDISGPKLGALVCLFLFATFQNTMYNLFHPIVPVSFFYQLGMIYLFLSFLRKGKWPYLMGALLFLVPATVRQTTPVILTAILIITTAAHGPKIRFLSMKYATILVMLLISFYIVTFSSVTSSGSIFSVFPDIPRMGSFIYERFLYYGAILTSGTAGMIMAPVFTFGVMHHLGSVIRDKTTLKSFNNWAWSILTIITVVLVWRFKTVAIYWLAFSILYLFVFDEKLRLPLGWAGASLLSFFSVGYYHDGYLLEAGFPLSLALGIIVIELVAPYMPLNSTIGSHFSRRGLALAVSGLFIGSLVVIGIGSRSDFIKRKFEVIEVIKVAADSNRNFKQFMDYLQQKIPQDAAIYELSEEELGTTLLDRRFFSLIERASRTKIMNIEDTLVMLKVLNRDDIRLYSSSALDSSTRGEERYFIALNRFERKIAEERFRLELIKEFKTNHDSAAVYRIAR